MKKIIVVPLILYLAACAQLPSPLQWPSRGQEAAFLRAFDDYAATRNTQALQEFRRTEPESPWTKRAGAILLANQELALCRERLQKLQKERDRLTQTLQQLEKEKEQHQLENQQLNEKIEQLKSLLIDLEKRPL